MFLRGPDPDKNVYAFQLHALRLEWAKLRDHMLELAPDEDVRAGFTDIDQVLAKTPDDFDDVTHVRDFCVLIRKNLDGFHATIAHYLQKFPTPIQEQADLDDPNR